MNFTQDVSDWELGAHLRPHPDGSAASGGLGLVTTWLVPVGLRGAPLGTVGDTDTRGKASGQCAEH